MLRSHCKSAIRLWCVIRCSHFVLFAAHLIVIIWMERMPIDHKSWGTIWNVYVLYACTRTRTGTHVIKFKMLNFYCFFVIQLRHTKRLVMFIKFLQYSGWQADRNLRCGPFIVLRLNGCTFNWYIAYTLCCCPCFWSLKVCPRKTTLNDWQLVNVAFLVYQLD